MVLFLGISHKSDCSSHRAVLELHDAQGKGEFFARPHEHMAQISACHPGRNCSKDSCPYGKRPTSSRSECLECSVGR